MKGNPMSSVNIIFLITVVAVFAALIPKAAAAEPSEFSAGAAKVDITPDPDSGEFWLGGYAPARRGLSVHDNLYARCLAIKNQDTTLVLISVDSTGILGGDIEKYKAEINNRTGIQSDQVLIAATHSHSAVDLFGLYGGVPQKYLNAQPGNMAQCAADALADLRPAVMRTASIQAEDLNGNRRHENRIPMDHEAVIVRLATLDGKTIATIANFGCHPVTFPREDTAIGADYVWALNRTLEADGGVGLFFIGAAGNANPESGTITKLAKSSNGYDIAEALGVELGRRLLEAIKSAKPVDKIALGASVDKFSVKVVNPPMKFLLMSGKVRMKLKAGAVPAEIGVITMGPVRIAAIPGELFAEQGMDLKTRLGGEVNFIITFANGYIGYMPTVADWNPDGYEESLAVDPNIENIVLEHFNRAMGK